MSAGRIPRWKQRLFELDAALPGTGSVGVRSSAGPPSPVIDRPGVPLAVQLAVVGSVAAWLVLWVWPPMTNGALPGAGVAALLGWGVWCRRRWCLWLLLAWMLLKTASDIEYASDDGVALTCALVVLDVIALASLLLPSSRRFAPSARDVLRNSIGDGYVDLARSVPITGPGTGLSDPTRQFHLRWQPTNEDYDQFLRVKRRLTNEVPAERLLGGLFAIAGILAAIGGDLTDGIWMAMIGTAVATGLADWIYRHVVVARRNRPLYDHEWDVTIDARGVDDISGGMRTQTPWNYWKVCVPTPSGLVLATRLKRRGVVLILARRGLDDGQDWEQLVQFVTAQIRRAGAPTFADAYEQPVAKT